MEPQEGRSGRFEASLHAFAKAVADRETVLTTMPVNSVYQRNTAAQSNGSDSVLFAPGPGETSE